VSFSDAIETAREMLKVLREKEKVDVWVSATAVWTRARTGATRTATTCACPGPS
jgi:hypothetical protein